MIGWTEFELLEKSQSPSKGEAQTIMLKFDEILPCTEELGEEFEEIKRKAEELTKTEEELKCKVDKELDTLCKKIMDLQNKSGCKSENSSKIVATVLKSRMDNLEVVEKE
ncbi:hypothetical protein TNIN_145131 [Trichonephila inaurata madagascariensis]|uniref:Uncharacterized protein n=1 Tax=Trichonephila inaurata madagascariensis TaxID=2747483 RepID=A0A8X7BW22_9ARAC|nr:hypothetical protein TNIN_145131 [Trichonephila inaurata madagascariensis]